MAPKALDVALLLLLVAAAGAEAMPRRLLQADARPALRVGMWHTDNAPRIEWVDGEPQGLEGLLMQELLDEAGYQPEVGWCGRQQGRRPAACAAACFAHTCHHCPRCSCAGGQAGDFRRPHPGPAEWDSGPGHGWCATAAAGAHALHCLQRGVTPAPAPAPSPRPRSLHRDPNPLPASRFHRAVLFQRRCVACYSTARPGSSVACTQPPLLAPRPTALCALGSAPPQAPRCTRRRATPAA